MASTRKQLKKRWEEPPGRAILERLHQRILALDSPDSREPRELFSLLEGLPFRDEVAGGRDLRGVPLEGGVRGVDFSGWDFSYAKLEFSLVDCDLRGARFDEAVVNGSITNDLRGASFRKANLRGGFFQGVDARNCCFDGAKLMSAGFQGANLEGSSFQGANCNGAIFVGANLVGCNFQGAILDEASLQEVRLDKTTDLRGASLINLFNEDHRDNAGRLLHAGTDWRLATYDETTRSGEDSSAQAIEVLGALVKRLEGEREPRGQRLLELTNQLRGELRQHYQDSWYEQLLARVPADERGWAEERVAEAVRSLV
ncbi:pentapeptide repeat-containing protein [Hyalangium gracile]|uniref:pentapeptide repeat-containing protein n=1 Tax=Hyalangium gracile TaxID=394092 RepID=UPI001CCB716D|nr:pentapeptide repeat-containing protein [Hyalangium gracile]